MDKNLHNCPLLSAYSDDKKFFDNNKDSIKFYNNMAEYSGHAFVAQTLVETVRKGRFLITVCNDIKPNCMDETKPIVHRQGRFLVTKQYVAVTRPPPKPSKPTVVKKGRFLVTLY